MNTISPKSVRRTLGLTTTDGANHHGDYNGTTTNNNNNNTNTNNNNSNGRTKGTRVDWHKDISYAVKAGRWETVRGHLSLQASIGKTQQQSAPMESPLASLDSGEGSSSSSFWSRLSARGLDTLSSASSSNNNLHDHTGLLTTDEDGRTPLHVALTSRRTPSDVILSMIRVEPKAVSVKNSRGRYPLHFAVVHRQHTTVIAELVDRFPAALAEPDTKGMSPLAYAVEGARQETHASQLSPATYYWMPVEDDSDQAVWQEQQGERWGIVHWLLLSLATHPQTSLVVMVGKKPMLVDALIYAAPPAVISLLIGASVMLLTNSQRANAFAGSTLFQCITRHYPLSILMSLVSQCPRDVRNVRDETGLGLVSSQFVSGCFRQDRKTREWSVVEDFHDTILETIDEEVLKEDDPAFLDWWRKIEFLVAFCSGTRDPAALPKTQLLHAALKNTDTPPLVVRMLLALYPQSIQLLDRETSAHALFIAASRREYVPRKYELAIMTSSSNSILEIVLSHEKRLIGKRHEERLPLHTAIDSGRTYAEYKCLVTSRPEYLLQRDPQTGLFPFLQAAAAATSQKKSTFRRMYVARNQYSYSDWMDLSDGAKAAKVQEVADLEELQELENSFQLLRLQPSVMDRLSFPRKQPLNVDRDERGVGMVASQFISWCYEEKEKAVWVERKENLTTFREALERASKHGDLGEVPLQFKSWWNKVKFWIRHCCPKKIPLLDDEIDIPDESDDFLLHAALLNPDTPPQIVSLLVLLHPKASALPLPGTYLLPLHIAAWCPEYTPRDFESCPERALEIVNRVHPSASRQKFRGALPLHLAIQSRKTWESIRPLVNTYPDGVHRRDPQTQLYPFQCLALAKDMSTDLRLRFQYLARNSQDTETWNCLTAFQRTRKVRMARRDHELQELDTTFELFRRSVHAVFPSTASDHSSRPPKNSLRNPFSSIHSESVSTRSAYSVSSKEPSMSVPMEDITETSVSENNQSSILRERTESLIRHLANFRQQAEKDDGDTSAVSNGMSTMSCTFHHDAETARYQDPESTRNSTEDDTEFGYSLADRSTSEVSHVSSTAEFAEESQSEFVPTKFGDGASYLGGSASYDDDDDESIDILPDEESTTEDDTEQDEDADTAVFFIIRRFPRFKTKMERDSKPSVTLTKKTGAELNFSAHGKPTIGREAQKALKNSSNHSNHSKNASSNNRTSMHSDMSYQTMQSEEKKKLRAKKEQKWVSKELYQKNKLLGNLQGAESSSDDENVMSFHGSFATDANDVFVKTEKAASQSLLKSSRHSQPREEPPKQPGKLPGIAAYLSSSKGRQPTREKEEASVISNTPSTLSYLQYHDASLFNTDGSTDRSSMMATDIDNSSFSASADSSYFDLKQNDGTESVLQMNDSTASNAVASLDHSATFSIPEGENEDETENTEDLEHSVSRRSHHKQTLSNVTEFEFREEIRTSERLRGSSEASLEDTSVGKTSAHEDSAREPSAYEASARDPLENDSCENEPSAPDATSVSSTNNSLESTQHSVESSSRTPIEQMTKVDANPVKAGTDRSDRTRSWNLPASTDKSEPRTISNNDGLERTTIVSAATGKSGRSTSSNRNGVELASAGANRSDRNTYSSTKGTEYTPASPANRPKPLVPVSIFTGNKILEPPAGETGTTSRANGVLNNKDTEQVKRFDPKVIDSGKVFDRKSMRWVTQDEATPKHPETSGRSDNQRPKVPLQHEFVDESYSTKEVLPATSTQNDAIVQSVGHDSDMYFDKKAMRWKTRAVPPRPKSTESNASRPRASIATLIENAHRSSSIGSHSSSRSLASNSSSIKGNKPNKISQSINRTAMPFVDIISREELRRRNARFMSRGIQKTRTPSDREFRQTWKTMFGDPD